MVTLGLLSSGFGTNVPVVSQIDSWLAHLPSDMESYIRPGCLVLTIFVSMPTCGWTEVHFLAEPPHHLTVIVRDGFEISLLIGL